MNHAGAVWDDRSAVGHVHGRTAAPKWLVCNAVDSIGLG
jgi:hypothetical protein